jgi:DNA-binding beta-propeller fold protein YncE
MSMPRSLIRVAAALGFLLCAAVVVWLGARASRQPAADKLGESFRYDTGELRKVDPALIVCDELAPIPSPVASPSAIAADAQNRLYVGGGRQIAVLDAAGKPVRTAQVEGRVSCIEVDAATNVYVGVGSHVAVIGPGDPARVRHWPSPGTNTVITSIAAAEDRVYVADAGNRLVYVCDSAGTILKKIGDGSGAGEFKRFIVPSPCFDLDMGTDGSLWAADPGRRRLLNFADDGTVRASWGRSSTDIEGFAGCCNPAHFVIAADGSFVTSEKHLVRVKLYRPDGSFDGVVAGPDSFGAGVEARDVAVAPDGRIFVLDPDRRAVRVFRRRQQP